MVIAVLIVFLWACERQTNNEKCKTLPATKHTMTIKD